MDRSYKIYKSYHTSHHNTTKNHLQISTPPSSVQQRTDIHNLPPNHMESQPSKLQASSNAPTLTTSPANHKETQPFLPAIQRSADGSSNSRHTTPLATLPTRFNTSHGQRTASEGLLSRLTLQEGSCFLGGGNLRCFKKSRCLSGFRREFEIF